MSPKSKNTQVVLFDLIKPDATWHKEWGVHGQVLWKGLPIFNLVEDVKQDKGRTFFLRADPMPTLACNWGAAGSLEALIERAHVAVGEFERFIKETHQRPKL